MANLIRMTEEFKQLIGEKFLLESKTKVWGFWEVNGTEVRISNHDEEFKDVAISGYLDETAREHPNTVVIPDGEGGQIYIPVEWVTIISKRIKTRWVPYRGEAKKPRKRSVK